MTAATRWLRQHDRALLGLASVTAVMLAWEVAALIEFTNPRFVGSPSAVIIAGIQEVQTAGFWANARASAFEFGVGYVTAAIAGVPLGIALGWYRRLSFFLEPLLNFIYATPMVALLPVIVLAVGINVWSKVVVVFLISWIMITLTTYLGVRTVDPRLLAVARVFGASDREVFRSVVLPGSLPFVLAGLRLGIGQAIIGVVVGELYAGSAGIGFMIVQASNNFQMARVLFGTIVLILVGFVAVESLRRVERRYAGWRVDAPLAA
jgi:ABC-type nitrate/sulfonate/bicarbonate transport system permease component